MKTTNDKTTHDEMRCWICHDTIEPGTETLEHAPLIEPPGFAWFCSEHTSKIEMSCMACTNAGASPGKHTKKSGCRYSPITTGEAS